MKSNLKALILASCISFSLFTSCQNETNQPAVQDEPEPQETVQDIVTGPKTDTVIIDKMKFIPEKLTINKGDTIVWLNKDFVVHNVTEQPDGMKSDSIEVGEVFKTVPDHSFDYICSIHPTMKAQIIINE